MDGKRRQDGACQRGAQAPSISRMDAQSRVAWIFAVLTGAFVLASVDACTKDSSPNGGGGSTEAPASSTAPAAPSAAPEAVNRAATINNFGVPISANKCPSAVPGSTTTVKELPDGVEVTVTAPGGPPINDIRQRGVQIVAAAKDPAIGGGSAADGLAKCPVVVKDAVVTETDVPGGAAFTLKPTKAGGLADLKKEAKSRVASYVAEGPK